MKKLDELDLKKKKLMIFDMDGTLIDSIGIWNRTDQEAIKIYGGPFVDEKTIQKERDAFLIAHQDEDLYRTYGEMLIKKYGLNCTGDEFLGKRWQLSCKMLEEEIGFKDGAASVVKRLKELGYLLALATTTTRVQLEVYGKKNKKMTAEMKIFDVFDFIASKEDVSRKKPDPEIYELLLDHFDLKPEDCLVFEDSLGGILAAKAAGIETVSVYDRYSDHDRKRINELSDYAISSFCEFMKLLEQGV